MHFSRTGTCRHAGSRVVLLQPLLWFPLFSGLARSGLALGLVLVLDGPARSHEPLSAPEPARAAASRPSATGGIAVIDLKYIFDHDPSIARAKADVDIDIKLAETMVELRKASVEKLRKDKQRESRESDEYQRLDRLLTNEMTELATQVQSQRAQFVRREADLYRQAYQRIQRVVDAYVEEAEIVVVLRFTRPESADSDDVKEVAMMLNRPVVAYKKPADITDEILRRLEKSPGLEVVRRPKSTAAPK